MSSPWLDMRIQEEQERRDREARTLDRLPGAFEELFHELADCIQRYKTAFGKDTAAIHEYGTKMRIDIREEKDGKWQSRAKVELAIVPAIPGFRVERPGSEPLDIIVGLLPGDKIFYRDQDQYITLEDLTRRILDRVLFPKLAE